MGYHVRRTRKATFSLWTKHDKKSRAHNFSLVRGPSQTLRTNTQDSQIRNDEDWDVAFAVVVAVVAAVVTADDDDDDDACADPIGFNGYSSCLQDK